MRSLLRGSSLLSVAKTIAVVGFATLLNCVPPTTDEGAGVATRLMFATQPGSTTSGATIAPAVVVTVVDVDGNVVLDATNSITIAITSGSGASGAQLGGSLTVTAVAGIAAFTNLTIDKAGSGYTLTATTPGLETASSSSFSVAPGAAAGLAFNANPSSGVGGGAITPAVRIAITDNAGNTVTTATNAISVALAGSTGAVLSGTTSATAANGVATFSNLSIDKAGSGYQLTASATGLTGATSSAFNVNVGAPSRLVVTTQPANIGVGQSFTIAATIRDAGGNTVTGATNNVTVAITAGSGSTGAALQGTTTVTPVNGVATFAGLSIDKPGVSYTLTIASAGLTSATTNPFNVIVGAAAALRFSEQPSAMTSGASATFKVEVVDAGGNVVPTASNAITLALVSGTGTSGATLGGTLTASPTAGVATFNNITIDKSGTGYQLQATSGTLTAATTNAFTVAAGAATRLEFGSQPSTLAAGATGPFTVRVMDAAGNTVTTATSSVTLAIEAGTGTSGAVLGGTLTQSAVAGVASFGNISVDRAGTGYKLRATGTGLTSALSSAFDVTAVPSLSFTVQPSNVSAGSSIAPSIQVTLRDATGNVASSATTAVTLAIVSGSGTSGAALSGTTTVNAVAGVATFSNLSIDKVGTAYQLRATAASYVSATSTAFNVSAGAAARLEFSSQPVNVAVGATAPLNVRVTDAAGNTVTTATPSVTLAIETGTGTSGAVLGGTLTQNAVNGVATFNISVDRAGTGYKLRATSAGLTSALSSAFDVTTSASLSFTVQPSNVVAGSSIAPSIQVTLRDATGNVATSATTAVTLAIASGTGTSGATLIGTATVNAVSGVATFSNLSIGKSGTGYQLLASAASYTSATSTVFNVTPGAATKLVVTTTPSGVTVGASASFTVAVRDAFDNVVTSATNSITLAIETGTGTSGAVLGGTLTQSAVAGVATFNNITVDRAGAAYKIRATSAGLTSALSPAFDVTTAAALSFTVQPSSVSAGNSIAPSIQVTLRDATGNVATSATTAVTLAIASGTGASGATLLGTKTVNAVSGVATFGNIAIDKVGTGYQLVATAASYVGATSTAFSVTPGAAAKLSVTSAPAGMTAGQTATFGITVLDVNDNVVTTATNAITLAIMSSTGRAGAVLGGTLTVSATAGVATFGNITIDKAGANYRLTASSSGLASANTPLFNVTTTPTLVFTQQPTSTTAGAAVSPAITVTTRDALGDASGSAAVTLAIASGTNASGATLLGTTTVNAVAGVATFSNIAVDKVGAGYQLTATAPTYSSLNSSSFNITPGAAAALVVTSQPANMVAGNPGTFEITVVDAFDNVVTAAANSITLSIVAGTGASGATLAGTLTRTPANGVAAFSGISIAKAGSAYKLRAAASGLTPDTTAAFNVLPGAPATLTFAQQPTSTNVNVSFAPTVTVSVTDANGNVVTSATNAVSLSIKSGTGADGASLTGTLAATPVNGVVEFPNVAVTEAGTGYQLEATSSGLTTATSTTFDIGTGVMAGLARLDVTPATSTVAVSQTVSLSATLVDVAGNTTPASPLWATSNPGIATVSASGVVTALRTGTVTITATQAGVVGRATITVTP